MSRLLSRENIKLVIVAVACLLVAWTAPSVAHGVHAAFAHNADKVDNKHAVGPGATLSGAAGNLVAHNSQGKLPAKFVAPASTITTTHPATAWTPNTTSPASVQPYSESTIVSGNGGMQIPLAAPQAFGTSRYGLHQVTLCYSANAPGFIDELYVWGQTASGPEVLLVDNTNRASATSTCYTIAVGKRAPYGASIYVALNGGGSVTLRNVRAVWSLNTASVAPRVGRDASARVGGSR